MMRENTKGNLRQPKIEAALLGVARHNMLANQIPGPATELNTTRSFKNKAIKIKIEQIESVNNTEQYL